MCCIFYRLRTVTVKMFCTPGLSAPFCFEEFSEANEPVLWSMESRARLWAAPFAGATLSQQSSSVFLGEKSWNQILSPQAQTRCWGCVPAPPSFLLVLFSVLRLALRLTPSTPPTPLSLALPLQLPVLCTAEAGRACFFSCSGQTEVLKPRQGKWTAEEEARGGF